MIDKKYIIRVLGRMICFVAVLALATACAGDELLDSSADGAEQEGLSISLTLDGMQLASRSTQSDPLLNEDAVKRMDVFLFGPNEAFMQYASAGDVTSSVSVEKVTLYQGSNWKENFIDDNQYTLYVLANYKGEADLSKITTVQGLKDLVATDKDIAKWEGMDEGTEKYTGKTFLMDGKKVFKGSELDKSQSTYNIQVDVKRAAVKVEVTLQYSDEWKNKFTATDLEAQFANYATATAAFAEAPMLDADKRGFTTYPEATTSVLDRFSSAPVFFKNKDDNYNGSKIRFYAYVNTWEQEVSNETMFLVDLPGNIQKDNGSVETLKNNFYKIPIVPNSQEKILNRNTFYQVTAVVDMEGSSTIDEPVELKDVKIEVEDWKRTEINVGTGDNPEYLMLNEYHVEIRNVDGYDGLRFYSSAPIDKVEIVEFENQDEATKAGVDFTYPGDKTLEGSGRYEKETDKIPGAFYVNKDNKRKSVSGISVDFEPNVNNGWIHLISKNPENVTKRYITLKVTSGDNVKYVVVEQYPLEYIQPIAGYYSYRDDKKNEGGTYEQKGSSYGKDTPTIKNGNSYVFVSKVISGTSIKGWYWKSRNASTPTTANAGSYDYISFPNNNMMYYVTITKTSEDYKLAHPMTISQTINKKEQLVAVNSEENNQLVSPSFMLASQLGTTVWPSSWGWSKAREHCANYVETYQKNGRTYVLDDWRLPTSKEISIIVEYQDDTPDVMDEVLSGSYYYVVWSEAQDNQWAPEGTAYTGKSGGSAAVRCIRDVKPTDDFLQK